MECTPGFYTVRDDSGQMPDESYCAGHLVEEGEYLRRHGLDDSGAIWVLGEEWRDGENARPRCDVLTCVHHEAA